MIRLHGHRGGYTIIETLIYLGVTSMLFVSAAALISGQQGKTEFVQSVREVESYISDISNDVSTGYFPSSDVGCNHVGSGPVLVGSGELGTRGSCLYIGRLFHVFPDEADGDHRITVYTIVGTRKQSTAANSPEATNLSEANVSIFPGQLIETKDFSSSISFDSIEYAGRDTSAFGFTSSLNSTIGGNDSWATVAKSLTVRNTDVGSETPNEIKNAFEQDSSRIENPGEITICINSNATDQHAILRVGSGSSSKGIFTVINPGGCP